MIGSDAGRSICLFSTDSPLRSTTGDLEGMALYAGEGAAKIDRIVGAEERLRSIAFARLARRERSAKVAEGSANLAVVARVLRRRARYRP